MKFLVVMILLIASALGVHYSGVDVSGWLEKESLKKISAVKPKSIREKRAEIPPTKAEYTFFETLNDKTMTRHIGLNGELLPAELVPEKSAPTVKPVKTKTASIASVTPKTQPASPIQTKAKNSFPQETVSAFEIKGQPNFAVQVSSSRNADSAGALKLRLQKNGFDAFLTQTKLAGQTWHRVFLGRYAKEQEAKDAVLLAKKQYQLNAVVVRIVN